MPHQNRCHNVGAVRWLEHSNGGIVKILLLNTSIIDGS